MEEKIGNVILNLTDYSGQDYYCDGDIEDALLQIVMSRKESDDFTDVILTDNRWPVLYHLSDERKNIIDVMRIDQNDSLLEIGAGCGALSGGLADRAAKVTCVELSKKRSLINAYRNSEYSNIIIKVGNFRDISFTDSYDVITLIGVLEYAGNYMDGGAAAYPALLQSAYELLNPGGRLYVAIENKYGLKYFAGCVEDHTGRVFDGIEDYTQTEIAKTFAKSELQDYLEKSGFSETFFYYPMPDYKFASVIYSDRKLPKVGEIYHLLSNYDRPRDLLFSEEAAFNGIIKAGYFDIFANSFLVEAVKGAR